MKVYLVVLLVINIKQMWCNCQKLDETLNKSRTNCCVSVYHIYSHINPQGFLKSPLEYSQLNFNSNNEKTIECVYNFRGNEGEKVQLFYMDLDLYNIENNRVDCRYTDSICMKFSENPRSKRLTQQNKATNLFTKSAIDYDKCDCVNMSYVSKQIMSSGPYMHVAFRTIPRILKQSLIERNASKNIREYRGYKIFYKFIKDTEILGIEQDTKSVNPIGVCNVYINSVIKKRGLISTPNYPGLYPRNTICTFNFYGQSNEKVRITFFTFDIEGVEACTNDTKSDYVEVSNFQNTDRIFRRYCGNNIPGTILSESHYFRIIFFSNNAFDGRGFQALYQFINTEATTQKEQQTTPANKSLSIHFYKYSINAFTIVFLLIIKKQISLIGI